MQTSKYTKLISYNKGYYAYNSVSNFLIKLDKELFNILDSDTNISLEDTEILDVLKKNKIITENESDDILEYVSILEKKRRLSSILNLTLAPTMDCNFHCSYCFETKEKGEMDEKTLNNIINLIKISNCASLNIAWFGGEPLLAINAIKMFYEKFKCINDVKISYASIITNGYYLTDSNLTLLRELGVKFIQLSMDGIYESHNRKRFSKTDKDTFSTIIKNIDNFHKRKYEDMHMGIRMNIDSENINEYDKIHSFFEERYKNNKNITINPAFIIDTTKGKNTTTIKNRNSKIEFNKLLTEKFNSTKYIYPSNNFDECAIRNFNAWAIDAKGDVYKCWEIIGNKEYKVGELTDRGIKILNKTLLNRYLHGSDPLRDKKCSNCISLPICGGGCPHKRIENDFNNKEFSVSPYCDNGLDDYLIERIKLYENKK
ncbi:MAG: radical SAM protein [Bacteroidales bacterium]